MVLRGVPSQGKYFWEEKVLLSGIEGIPSLTKDGNPETTEIDMTFGAIGLRGDTAILQA